MVLDEKTLIEYYVFIIKAGKNYVRRKKNKSGSTSVQVIKKQGGKSRLVRSFGCAQSEKEISNLEKQAEKWIEEYSSPRKLDSDLRIGFVIT